MAYGRNVVVAKERRRVPRATPPPVATGAFQLYVAAADIEKEEVQSLIADLTARVEALETPTPPVP